MVRKKGQCDQQSVTGSQCPSSASLVLGKKCCRAQDHDPGTVFSPWISVC